MFNTHSIIYIKLNSIILELLEFDRFWFDRFFPNALSCWSLRYLCNALL